MDANMLRELMEPITADNIHELKPGEWIWDNQDIGRREHRRTLNPETVVEKIGFRQIHILDLDLYPRRSSKPFMLSSIEVDGYKWEYFEYGRYYKFKKRGGSSMDKTFKEYCGHIDNLIENDSIASSLKLIGEYINNGPTDGVTGLALGQLVTDICLLERRVSELEQSLDECTREPKVIAADFDGTLCEDAYPGIGEPKLTVIEHLKWRKRKGDKLILWTCRVDERLDEAVDWCLDQGLIFDAVNDNLPELVAKYGGNPRKVFADIYLDDRAADCMFLEDVKED